MHHLNITIKYHLDTFWAATWDNQPQHVQDLIHHIDYIVCGGRGLISIFLESKDNSGWRKYQGTPWLDSQSSPIMEKLTSNGEIW